MQQETIAGKACACLSIDYWQIYFDVDHSDISSRLKACINPISSELQELVDNKIDLYGPFWISTSLIFSMIITGNLYQIMGHIFTNSNFEYDYTQIGSAVSLVYTALIVFPLLYYGLNKVLGTSIGLLKTLSIYGYSFTPFLIASILYVIPFYWIRILLMIGAGAHSIVFLITNFKK